MSKSVAIIGGGIAGLCAGCFALEKGFPVTIFEQNEIPGGLCTAWKRGDYTIDFCIHWLTGATGNNDLFKTWQFLGVIDPLTYTFPDEFMRIVGIDGTSLIFTKDLDKLEADMLALAPEDAKEIKQLIKAIKRFARSNFGLTHSNTYWQKLVSLIRLISLLPVFKKYGRLSLKDLGALFKNPFLSNALASTWDPRLSAMILLGMLAWHHRGICGYPIGGSMAFARALEKRFLELGGTIHYKAAVSKVVTHDQKAVGVELKDGTLFTSDYVISAADSHQTFYQLLENKHTTPKVASYFQELPLFGPLLFVAFGVKKTFENVSQQVSCSLFQIPKTPIADRDHEWLQVKIYNQDNTLAPEGKTLVTVLIDSDYEYWKKLAQDPVAYQAAKESVVQTIIPLLDQLIPGIAQDIEMHDVSTPLTVNRYTSNWKGSYEGWLPTPKTIIMSMEKTVPTLQNFYMVGHWVQPGGGLPSCVMTAQEVVKML